jgi:hypothetical protein
MIEPTAKLQKHTLFLFPGDYARVAERYPNSGAAKIIRLLVRRLVKDIDAKADLPNIEELKQGFEGEL